MPATRAIAQEMDAAVKGKEVGIYDIEAAQKRVGMGPVERAAMKARAEQASATVGHGRCRGPHGSGPAPRHRRTASR